jgi:hypothetical protein
MKHLAAILLFALCATASAQTIKTLGYNTTNGQVVYTNTNTLTFSNPANFTDTNVGLSATNLIGSYVEVQKWLFFPSTASNNPIQFEDAATRTNVLHSLGVGPTNNVQFAQAQIGTDAVIGDNSISWGGSEIINFEDRTLLNGNWQVDSGSFNVVGDTNKAITRTNLGLGGGITATNVFVDLSTNTNTVTISNGIITSWTVTP